MHEAWSWFNYLPFHEEFMHFVQRLGDEQGQTYLMGQRIEVQHVYAAILVLLLLVVIGLATRVSIGNPREAIVPPAKLTVRNFSELMVGLVLDQMAGLMGHKAARYFLPLIGTCAFFILFSNMLGLVPGFLPATDSLNTTLACTAVVFVTTHLYGIREHGFGYFKRFVGPIPVLFPLMLPIELMTHFVIRPGSLAIRLMANMMADHMVLGVFLSGLAIGAWAWWVPVPVAMYALGLLVAVVQTLVFCLLSTIYIAEAIEEAH